jgi:hypothetical protein
MSAKCKEIIRAAGLRDALTFTSFRHGGFTKAADADLSDAQMRAAGRHKSAKVLPTYAKRTMNAGRRGRDRIERASAGAFRHDDCGATALATCRSAHAGIAVRIWSG